MNFGESPFNGRMGQPVVRSHGRQKDQGPHVHLTALDHVGRSRTSGQTQTRHADERKTQERQQDETYRFHDWRRHERRRLSGDGNI